MNTPATSSVPRLALPVLLAVSGLALGGASCDKQTASTSEADDVVRAADRAEGKDPPAEADPNASAQTAAHGHAHDGDDGHSHDGHGHSHGHGAPAEPMVIPDDLDTTPLKGVDLAKLDEEKTKRFYAHAAVLPSPCGKAHSLRTSLTEDATCKRAPFAARYVVELIADEASDAEVKNLYDGHYKNVPEKQIDISGDVPRFGPPDAPVKVVEFYDYGCPACKAYKPVIDEAMKGFTDTAAIYFKQYPLPGHIHSKSASQAALAAHEQGKFREMHALLFMKAPAHRKAEVRSYAEALGLDMARFDANYEASRARVEADIAQGEAAGVNSVPTIFINGRQYRGITHPKYLAMWIEEELAVNR